MNCFQACRWAMWCSSQVPGLSPPLTARCVPILHQGFLPHLWPPGPPAHCYGPPLGWSCPPAWWQAPHWQAHASEPGAAGPPPASPPAPQPWRRSCAGAQALGATQLGPARGGQDHAPAKCMWPKLAFADGETARQLCTMLQDLQEAQVSLDHQQSYGPFPLLGNIATDVRWPLSSMAINEVHTSCWLSASRCHHQRPRCAAVGTCLLGQQAHGHGGGVDHAHALMLQVGQQFLQAVVHQGVVAVAQHAVHAARRNSAGVPGVRV